MMLVACPKCGTQYEVEESGRYECTCGCLFDVEMPQEEIPASSIQQGEQNKETPKHESNATQTTLQKIGSWMNIIIAKWQSLSKKQKLIVGGVLIVIAMWVIPATSAESQFLRGKKYAEGDGVLKDLKIAAEWYRKAAARGHAKAQNNLGVCYLTGNGVEKDPKQAVYWYRKAAKQGLPVAQNNLAGCYSDGYGVEKDIKQAVYWYRKAAEGGYANAQYQLGLLYCSGTGVGTDTKQGIYWISKAAEQGNGDAEAWLHIMNKLRGR